MVLPRGHEDEWVLLMSEMSLNNPSSSLRVVSLFRQRKGSLATASYKLHAQPLLTAKGPHQYRLYIKHPREEATVTTRRFVFMPATSPKNGSKTEI
jgi:hypothetical protein